MKYRIIMEKYYEGGVPYSAPQIRYKVQKRIFFVWFDVGNMNQGGGTTIPYFRKKEKAEEFLLKHKYSRDKVIKTIKIK